MKITINRNCKAIVYRQIDPNMLTLLNSNLILWWVALPLIMYELEDFMRALNSRNSLERNHNVVYNARSRGV
ncbi:hypothetical protein BLOT_000861 [Blomia tropicalis]|nr:hypothetical protein BLOT_000861 [Blomia tropicalis]